jgi:heat shock protein HslJ
MKNIFTLMIAAAMVFAACSKDDEENSHPLVGTWVFREANMTFLFEGDWYDAKEEGVDMSEVNKSLRGLFFVFEKDGQLLGGKNGQSQPAGNYTVSGDKITIKDGTYTFIMGYRLSGETLELIWPRTTFEIMLGALPDELYWFDDFEAILTLVKAD